MTHAIGVSVNRKSPFIFLSLMCSLSRLLGETFCLTKVLFSLLKSGFLNIENTDSLCIQILSETWTTRYTREETRDYRSVVKSRLTRVFPSWRRSKRTNTSDKVTGVLQLTALRPFVVKPRPRMSNKNVGRYQVKWKQF